MSDWPEVTEDTSPGEIDRLLALAERRYWLANRQADTGPRHRSRGRRSEAKTEETISLDEYIRRRDSAA